MRLALSAGTLIVAGLLVVCSPAALGSTTHPVEDQLRRHFPSVPIESAAAWDAAEAVVHGRRVAGLRARMPEAAVRVVYGTSYADEFSVEGGGARVVLRAVGARPAAAVQSNGKLIYERAYNGTDIVEVPFAGRSEELLILQDRAATHTFEYDIVETEGVAAVVMDGGAIRFLPDLASIPKPSGGVIRPLEILEIDKPWIVDAFGQRSEANAQWTLVGEGPIPKKLRLTVGGEKLSYPIVVDPTFSVTGNMIMPRMNHTATLLPNGKVLIAGGALSGVRTSTAELFDPATGSFSPLPNMNEVRSKHTATLLPNGKVFLFGGDNVAATSAGAELFDPTDNTFTSISGTFVHRHDHTATLLKNGKVLLVGGSDPVDAALSTAQVYDPATDSFATAITLARSYDKHTATLLATGKVLIAGGASALFTAPDVYDPGTGTVTASAAAVVGRYCHTATLLPNGKVLIAGGSDSMNAELATGYLFDPAGSGSSTGTGTMAYARATASAALLPNGKVLFTGGYNGNVWCPYIELFDPAGAGSFTPMGSAPLARSTHTTTLLPGGRVLIAGGNALPLVELYDSAAPAFASAGSLTTDRDNATATLLPDGRVLVAGGRTLFTATATTERYDSAGSAASASSAMSVGRAHHTATLLTNGKVLIAGGANESAVHASMQLYDPTAGTFSATASLQTARYWHTATLLPNGNVLLAGGCIGTDMNNGSPTKSAELYLTDGSVMATGNLVASRAWHTATLLATGNVLLAGGGGWAGTTAELYDPATGTSTLTGSMTTFRWLHYTATLLRSGKVLIAGGLCSTSAACKSAEVYDPASGTFTPTATTMTAPRSEHTATMLPDGRVLIAGGYDGNAALSSTDIYDPATNGFTPGPPLTGARHRHTATLLVNGNVLVTSGIPNPSGLLFNPGTGVADARRPLISFWPQSTTPAGVLDLTGTSFRSDSAASSGSTGDSPTNTPLLHLQRVDNEQITFVAPATFSDTGFTSVALPGVANGYYRVTIVSNGVESMQRLVLISYPAPTISGIAPDNGPTNSSPAVTISGTNLDTTQGVTFRGVSAGFNSATATSLNVYPPANVSGSAAVIVTTRGGSAVTSYTYLFSAPGSMTATGWASSVNVLWAQRTGAARYEIARSSDGTSYTTVAATSGTEFIDYGVAANTAYLYKVRAVEGNGNTSPYTAPDLAVTVVHPDTLYPRTTVIRAAHIEALRTALNAARALASLTPMAFTDSPIVPGVTPVRAGHLLELRSGYDEVQQKLLLQALTYQPITAGVSVISTTHVNQLRNALR